MAVGINATGIPSWTCKPSAAGNTRASAPLTASTTCGSVSQPGRKGPTPSAPRSELTPVMSNRTFTPVSGLKIQRQTTPVTMNDSE